MIDGSALRRVLQKCDFSYSVPWNGLLITLGAFIFALGVRPVAVPHGFLSGGVSGLGLLLYYSLGLVGPGVWYLLLNAPIFVLGWLYVSRRFMLYSVYGVGVLSLFIEAVPWRFPIGDAMLAALAGGALMGAGSGLILRSLGSAGGLDIIAIILNQRYNLRIGQFFFGFNLCLYAAALRYVQTDLVLYSLAMNYVSSQVIDAVTGLFNQRKAVFIVSERPREVAAAVVERIQRGATYLYGEGAYTGKEKKVVLTVVNNLELKRLEEEVFRIDPEAFLIIENTFNVLGKGFSRRKVY